MNDKTTKMGIKNLLLWCVKKKLFFFFFFSIRRNMEKNDKPTAGKFFFFFFFVVWFEVNIFSMRFPLPMKIVLVFDALSLVKF